ncbi:MAG: 1-deoxy-D-xylulose-5-phosphate reductoisomerase, partial [Pseudomonadota bacterium]
EVLVTLKMSDSSKGIAILGSTGSVGCSTLNVIDKHPDKFHVVALGAHKSVTELLAQTQKFTPSHVVITDKTSASAFKSEIVGMEHVPNVIEGAEGLHDIVSLSEVDCVMAAIVGAAGLPSTVHAAQSGKTVLLANKEALVMSGELLMREAKKNNATLLPIDSEHNAVFQCLANIADKQTKTGVKKVILTASGGPFLQTPLSELNDVTPEQACAHPNWDMGRKISVDSATMMNKGLELIEACLLFDLEPSQIDVVIHPQSIVHAMVAYKDGSMLAHMGYPDMRVPIAHAIAWPQRIESGVDMLDVTASPKLEFFMPDLDRFPCLKLAMEVIQSGQSAPAIMSAANEIAVQAFLDNKIKFTDIYNVVSMVIENMESVSIDSLQTILDVDREARELAKSKISGIIH